MTAFSCLLAIGFEVLNFIKARDFPLIKNISVQKL